MPADLEVWSGKAPAPHALAGAPLDTIARTPGRAVVGVASVGSPYAPRFAQGANLVPRLLFRVEPDDQSALGAPAGRRPVRSQRTVSEKVPWKKLSPLTGAVEDQYIWPTILGEHVLPFRIAPPADFVLPLTRDGEVLGPSGNKIDRWPGLASWMRQADEIWRNNQDGKLTLIKQIDHMKKLSQQAPFPGTRVVYAASGMHVSAAVLRNPRVVVEHGVYWAAVASPDEATFLVSILNTPSLTDLVRPHMSYGKDERHIDKNVWKLPIPTYDLGDPVHLRIVELGDQLTDRVGEVGFTSSYFVTQRKAVRTFLADSPEGKELDALVSKVVSG